MSWILSHVAEVTAIFFAVLRFAESVSIATKTETDNKIIAIIKEFFKPDFFK